MADVSTHFDVEIEQDVDGRWIGEVVSMPGVMVYGASPKDARTRAEKLARQVIQDREETTSPYERPEFE